MKCELQLWPLVEQWSRELTLAILIKRGTATVHHLLVGQWPAVPLAACDPLQQQLHVMGPACVVCLSPVWRTVVVAVLSTAACCTLLGLTAAYTPRIHAIMEEVGGQFNVNMQEGSLLIPNLHFEHIPLKCNPC